VACFLKSKEFCWFYIGGWRLVTGMCWRHYLVMLRNVPSVDKLQLQIGAPVVVVNGTVEGEHASV